jgi:hypothetical protein
MPVLPRPALLPCTLCCCCCRHIGPAGAEWSCQTSLPSCPQDTEPARQPTSCVSWCAPLSESQQGIWTRLGSTQSCAAHLCAHAHVLGDTSAAFHLVMWCVPLCAHSVLVPGPSRDGYRCRHSQDFACVVVHTCVCMCCVCCVCDCQASNRQHFARQC